LRGLDYAAHRRVVRNMRENNRVGIELTDVTKRKAEQIEYLIADLIELEKKSPHAFQAGVRIVQLPQR
jgi:hypothetical protein